MNNKESQLNEIMGTKLKLLRVSKGYSLQYVADRVLPSKNRATIQHYEAGRAAPGLKLLKQICTLYDVDVLKFLSEVYEEAYKYI